MEERKGYIPGIIVGLAIGVVVFFAVVKILALF